MTLLLATSTHEHFCTRMTYGCVCVCAAENSRITYLDSLPIRFKHGIPHLIRRSNIYEDVVTLYNSSGEDIFRERPFRVRFHKEKALDIGGVSRDMFSAFFEEMYIKLFDGSSLLTPIDYAKFKVSPYPILGTIMSHAYLVAGVLPVKIAFPTLCAMLLNNADLIPDDVMISSFVDSLNNFEASIVSAALQVVKDQKNFSKEIEAKLIDIYSRYGVYEVPKPGNLLELVTGISRHHFFRKPAAAIAEVRSGIPEVYSDFWKSMSIGDFFSIYRAMQVSTEKVLRMIDKVTLNNSGQKRVFGFLQQYIGNMRHDELRRFLRFVTGSAVCSSRAIGITFNNVDGLARRPIGHTCPHILELSTSYKSCQEFANEFSCILSNDEYGEYGEYTWQMDAI